MDDTASILHAWCEGFLASGDCPDAELIVTLARLPLQEHRWRREALISPEGASTAEVARWALARFVKEVRLHGPGRFIVSAFTVGGRVLGSLRLELGEHAVLVSHQASLTFEPPPAVDDPHFRLMREILLRTYRKNSHAGEA